MNKTIRADRPVNVVAVFSSMVSGVAPSFGIEEALQSLCARGLPEPKKFRAAPALHSPPENRTSEGSQSPVAEVSL